MYIHTLHTLHTGVAHLSEKTDLPPSHLDYATMWMETKSIKREQQNIKAKLASMEQSIKRALEMAAISKTKKERGSMLWEMLSDHHTEIALVAGALLGAAIAARKR
mmetsp:Transcript_20842/g.40362  ORF Transcript_20842/g.40362 Transcript_20842/m.40362 type:complete len:106 (+) Transcript_20842:54-371(+)